MNKLGQFLIDNYTIKELYDLSPKALRILIESIKAYQQEVKVDWVWNTARYNSIS